MIIARELFKTMNNIKGHTSIVNRLYVMNLDNNAKTSITLTLNVARLTEIPQVCGTAVCHK